MNFSTSSVNFFFVNYDLHKFKCCDIILLVCWLRRITHKLHGNSMCCHVAKVGRSVNAPVPIWQRIIYQSSIISDHFQCGQNVTLEIVNCIPFSIHFFLFNIFNMGFSAGLSSDCSAMQTRRANQASCWYAFYFKFDESDVAAFIFSLINLERWKLKSVQIAVRNLLFFYRCDSV